MRVYRIRDWAEIYEKNRTREMVRMWWVPIPVKLEGEGYVTMMMEKDGATLYGCWLALVLVAAQGHPRGTLMRGNGVPHDSYSIARTTRIPERLIMRSLLFFSHEPMDWLEIIEIPNVGAGAASSAGNPQEGAAGVRDGCGEPAQDKRREEEIRLEERRLLVDIARLSPLADLWNEIVVDLPKVESVPESRRRKEVARLKELPLDRWKLAFEKVQASDFLRGKTPPRAGKRPFRASFDWIITNDRNVLKVLEGNYDNEAEVLPLELVKKNLKVVIR